MKKIKLTQGKVSFVDDDMYLIISSLKWCAAKKKNIFYAERTGGESMHHYVIGKPTGKLVVDHINGNGLDNRRANLRIVDRRANGQNRSSHRNGRLPGATFQNGKWKSVIRVNGNRIFIGNYSTEAEANKSYVDYQENILER